MKHFRMRMLCLLMALLLAVPAALAEEVGEPVPVDEAGEILPIDEVGEVDLYDPSVYAGELPADTPIVTDAPTLTPEATLPPEEATPAPDIPPEAEATPEPELPAEGEVTPEPEATPEPLDGWALALQVWQDGEIPEGALALGVGERRRLNGAALVGGALPLSYASSDESVAAVDALTGEILPIKKGLAVIEVTSADGQRAEQVVAVLNAPTAVAFPAKTLTLGKGETRAFAAAIPDGSAGAIAYGTNKKAYAVIDANGNVRGVKAGKATIKAVTYNGKSVTCTVKVVKAPSKVTLSAKTLVVCPGESRRLTAKLPKGTASALAWTSSDPAVATVDAAGNVRAVAAGAATITVRTFNGKKAACKVTVLDGEAPTSVTLSAVTLTLGVKEKATLVPAIPEGAATVYAWATKNKKIATVSASGVVTAKRTGTTKIAVKTHNGLTALCTVKVVKAPAKLALSPAKLTIKAGETAALKPSLPKGGASAIRYASSNPAVATVDASGLVTALQPGTAVIAASTFNGKKASCAVTVQPAVEPKVTGGFDEKAVTLRPGEKYTLKGWAKVEDGALDTVNVRVSAGGKQTTASTRAAAGRTLMTLQDGAWASTFTLTAGSAPFAAEGTYTLELMASAQGGAMSAALDTMTVTVSKSAPTGTAKMIANLRADNSLGLGAKKDAIISIVQLLMETGGYDPAFAAGVAANVYAEGNYGFFESSKYVSSPTSRPKYFCYLDGGAYYKSGVLTAVYLSKEDYAKYKGSAEKYLRFGPENYYLNTYSGKYVTSVNLNELEALMDALEKGNWTGKFGLGVTQWTGSRTKTLVQFYRRHAGAGASTITKAQVMAAENELILYELKGSYAHIYTTWKGNNAGKLASEAAAYDAGSLLCLKYEIPAGKETKAVTRGNKAKAIYRVMVGSN